MRKSPWHLLAGAALLGLAAGCNGPAAPEKADKPPTSAPAAPTVTVVRPTKATVRHPIEQPGFNVEAFEETPLYPKIAGYLRVPKGRKWFADLGDNVRKGEVLAELYVPEMVVDVRRKEAAVKQAAAQIQQARAAVKTAQAQLDRTRSQYERFARIGRQGIVDRENIDETRYTYQAAQAGLEKANADVVAAEAQLAAAEADRDYAQTMLAYRAIRAPFDGVITRRKVNTEDLVQMTGIRGQPLFVVVRTDPVRVFVNVPAADAVLVRDKDPVTLRLQGAGGEVLHGHVTRNARSLDPLARTLRTEIDLPNPDGKLLPGMYVQASFIVEHPGVWTLPAGAVRTEGDQTFCFLVEKGQAVRTPLQVGLSGGGRVEVRKKQTRAARAGTDGRWEDFTGKERVVADGAGALTDGQVVAVAR